MTLSDALQPIVTMHYPVVAFLIALNLQAAQSFKERRFGIIAMGWALNLAYLVSRNFATAALGSRGLLRVGDLEAPLTLLSSTAFWYAAWSPPGRGIHTLRAVPVALLWSVSILVTLWVSIAPSLLGLNPYWRFLAASIPRAVFNFVSIAALASFLAVESRKYGQTRRDTPLLYRATFFYALLQFAQLFTGPMPSVTPDLVKLAGFSFGLGLKGLILFGMVRLFAEAAGRTSDARARAAETQRTVELIAHELGTPISQMIVHIPEIAKEAGRRGRLASSVQTLAFAVHRVQAIMGAAKDLHVLGAFLKAGGQVLEGSESAPRVVSINTVVHTAVMAVKETRGERIQWSIQYAARSCVRCTAVELVQVVINVLRNACDAMPTGKGKIAIVTERLESEASQGHGMIRLTVRDDGEGLSDSVRHQLFREAVSTRGGPGRGHGLSVVKKYVERHGGTVRLDNAADVIGRGERGAVVVIELPRVPCAEWGAES